MPREYEQRRLQKMLLRYHDPKNWPSLRELFISMKRPDLIGTGPEQLVPPGNKLTGSKGAASRGSAVKSAGGQKTFKAASRRPIKPRKKPR